MVVASTGKIVRHIGILTQKNRIVKTARETPPVPFPLALQRCFFLMNQWHESNVSDLLCALTSKSVQSIWLELPCFSMGISGVLRKSLKNVKLFVVLRKVIRMLSRNRVFTVRKFNVRPRFESSGHHKPDAFFGRDLGVYQPPAFDIPFILCLRS